MRCLTVPNHRERAKGTLRALIREAGITRDQFAELLCRDVFGPIGSAGDEIGKKIATMSRRRLFGGRGIQG
jgi:hypothetical protein